MIVKCTNCGKDFEKLNSEVNRKLRQNSNAHFYCSYECYKAMMSVIRNAGMVEKICPVCNKKFETKNIKRSATYCSRSCASKGSINSNRIKAGKYAAKLNFTADTYGVKSIKNILDVRESWRYDELKYYLDNIGEKYEFEYILEDFIFDLALIDKGILIEFDEEYHQYTKEHDEIKNQCAIRNGWEIIRINVATNSVINKDCLYTVLMKRE